MAGVFYANLSNRPIDQPIDRDRNEYVTNTLTIGCSHAPLRVSHCAPLCAIVNAYLLRAKTLVLSSCFVFRDNFSCSAFLLESEDATATARFKGVHKIAVLLLPRARSGSDLLSFWASSSSPFGYHHITPWPELLHSLPTSSFFRRMNCPAASVSCELVLSIEYSNLFRCLRTRPSRLSATIQCTRNALWVHKNTSISTLQTLVSRQRWLALCSCRCCYCKRCRQQTLAAEMRAVRPRIWTGNRHEVSACRCSCSWLRST